LSIADRPVVLLWAERLWRCLEPAFPMGTWSEESDEIAAGAALSERTRAEIALEGVGAGQRSAAQAARDFGVGWHAAMSAVRDHDQPRVDHLARLGALVRPAQAVVGWLALKPTP
jgi:transposase